MTKHPFLTVFVLILSETNDATLQRWHYTNSPIPFCAFRAVRARLVNVPPRACGPQASRPIPLPTEPESREMSDRCTGFRAYDFTDC
jgi:hypothetical protein